MVVRQTIVNGDRVRKATSGIHVGNGKAARLSLFVILSRTMLQSFVTSIVYLTVSNERTDSITAA